MQVQLIYIHVLNLDTLGVLSTSTIIPNLSYGQCFLKLNIHNKYTWHCTCRNYWKMINACQCMTLYVFMYAFSGCTNLLLPTCICGVLISWKKANYCLQRQKNTCMHTFSYCHNPEKNIPYKHFVFYQVHFFFILSFWQMLHKKC